MPGAGPTVKLTFAGDSTDLERAMKRVSESADQMEKTFSVKSLAMGAAGAAAGAGLVQAFTDSLEFDAARAKLEAQIGAGSPMAEEAGKVAGSLYAKGYGESIGELGDTVRQVLQGGLLAEDATTEQIEALTGKVLSLAEAFGQDTTSAVNAVAQMLRTGLAANADEALDILTRGFQLGADKAGDLLDTINEYGTQFRKLGLDGTTAMGLISQGLQAGARDADMVADAIKEFSIRAVDGSKTTAEGFAAIGLSADEMAAKFAKGGPEAAAALDLVIDRLRGMQDPVAQSQTAVALFGTKAEDLGAALFALDPSAAVDAMGQVGGAADKVNATLQDTAANKIESVKRGFQDWMMSIVGVQGPLGDLAAGVVGLGGDALDIVGSLGMAAMALRGMGIASGIATAAQWALNAAMSANPIALVVLAIGALVAAIIWAWNNSETFRNIVLGVWEAVKNGISAAVDWIIGAIDWFKELPGKVAGWFGQMKDWAIRKAGEMVAWIKGLPGQILSAIGNLGSLLVNAGRDLLTGLWNGITGAAGWLKQKIGNFFSSLLPGWVKDMLGIRSPSRVFADEIGRWIPEGLAVGIEANLDPVKGATRDMTAAAMAPFPGASGMPRPAAPAAPASGGAVTVRFAGNVDSAFATYFMRLVRTGQIQFAT